MIRPVRHYTYRRPDRQGGTLRLVLQAIAVLVAVMLVVLVAIFAIPFLISGIG